MSFHQPLLGRSGAHWLDDPPDLSCQDTTRQHALDDPLLSCKQQVGGSSPPASSQSCRSGACCTCFAWAGSTRGSRLRRLPGVRLRRRPAGLLGRSSSWPATSPCPGLATFASPSTRLPAPPIKASRLSLGVRPGRMGARRRPAQADRQGPAHRRPLPPGPVASPRVPATGRVAAGCVAGQAPMTG